MEEPVGAQDYLWLHESGRVFYERIGDVETEAGGGGIGHVVIMTSRA